MTESQPQEIFDSPEVIPVLGEPVPLGRNLGDELAVRQYRHPEWTPNRPDAARAPYAPYFFDLQPGDIFWWPCTPDRGAGRTWHAVLIVRQSRDDEFERCYIVQWLRHPDPDAFPVTWEVCRSAVAFPLTHQERNAVRSDPSLRCLARHHLCAVLTNYHLARVAPAEAHILPECLAPHTFQPLLRYIHLLPERHHAGGPFRTPPDEWRQHSPGGTWLSPASPGSVDFDAGRPGRPDYPAIAEADVSTSSSAPSPAARRAGPAGGPAPPSPHPSSTSPQHIARQVPGDSRGYQGTRDGAGGSAALTSGRDADRAPSGSPMPVSEAGSPAHGLDAEREASGSPMPVSEAGSPAHDEQGPGEYDADHHAHETAGGPEWQTEDTRGGHCMARGGQADVGDGGADPSSKARWRDGLPWWHPDRLKPTTPAQPAISSWLHSDRRMSPQAGGVACEAGDGGRVIARQTPVSPAPAASAVPTAGAQSVTPPCQRRVHFETPPTTAGTQARQAGGTSCFPPPALRSGGFGADAGGGGEGSCTGGSHGQANGTGRQARCRAAGRDITAAGDRREEPDAAVGQCRGSVEQGGQAAAPPRGSGGAGGAAGDGAADHGAGGSSDDASPGSCSFRAPMPHFSSEEEEAEHRAGGSSADEGDQSPVLTRCDRLLARD